MKKFLDWIKSSKSDFALFILFIILLNIAGFNTFKRIDLTEPKSYSLSKASETLVKNLKEPLSIRVFFDKNLPSQYKTVEQYIEDLLDEYKGVANKNFSVSYMDMSKQKNIDLAQNLGLEQIQIQEVKNNEVGFKQAFMGIVLSYADEIEVIQSVTSQEGFEYLITSTISKMITTADALSNLSDKESIIVTLYYSSSLAELGIQGLDQVEKTVQQAFNEVNKQKQNRLFYTVVNPTSQQVEEYVNKYGIQGISFERDGIKENAALGLVIESGENYSVLPLYITKVPFLGNMVTGLESLTDSINQGIQTLVNKPNQIGYIVGHNEHDINKEDDCLNFNQLLSQRYKIVQIDLVNDEIPAGISTIIINGPETDYSGLECYKIDQFIMRGGNVMFFLDSLQQNQEKQNYFDGLPSFVPKTNTLDELLKKYGIEHQYNYVLDENCYTQNSRDAGKQSIYWIPTLQKKQLNQKHPITKNLAYVYVLMSGAVNMTGDNPDLKTTVLSKTSDHSWVYDGDGFLTPDFIQPPEPAEMKSQNVSILVEGKFTSAYDDAPDFDQQMNEENAEQDLISTNNFIKKATVPGKIFVTGSSLGTTYQLIDQNGSNPAAMFILNTVDYMNGNEDLCTMRTKGLSINTLNIKSPVLAKIFQIFNNYGIPVIVILIGLLIWRARNIRRNKINEKYNPDDKRTINKEKKNAKEEKED